VHGALPGAAGALTTFQDNSPAMGTVCLFAIAPPAPQKYCDAHLCVAFFECSTLQRIQQSHRQRRHHAIPPGAVPVWRQQVGVGVHLRSGHRMLQVLWIIETCAQGCRHHSRKSCKHRCSQSSWHWRCVQLL